MQRLGSCHEELVQGGMRDDPLSEVPLDLQLAALRCITAGLVMHGFSSNPGGRLRLHTRQLAQSAAHRNPMWQVAVSRVWAIRAEER